MWGLGSRFSDCLVPKRPLGLTRAARTPGLVPGDLSISWRLEYLQYYLKICDEEMIHAAYSNLRAVTEA